MYSPPPPSQPLPSIQGPAVGIIATGILNALASLYFLVTGAFQLITGTRGGVPGIEAQRSSEIAGYYIGSIIIIGFSLVGLVVAPYLVYAGVQMMKWEKFNVARNAAILAMIPVTSCCCLAGIPIGLWAYLTLKRPEVEAEFRS